MINPGYQTHDVPQKRGFSLELQCYTQVHTYKYTYIHTCKHTCKHRYIYTYLLTWSFIHRHMRVKDIHMGDPNMVILHIYGPKNHSQRPLAMPFGMGLHQ